MPVHLLPDGEFRRRLAVLVAQQFGPDGFGNCFLQVFDHDGELMAIQDAGRFDVPTEADTVVDMKALTTAGVVGLRPS